MSVGDFRRLTPEEFGEIAKAHVESEERRERGAWERMRVAAAIAVQPHCKSKVDPKKMLPMPWDEKPKRKASGISREEAHQRFLRLTGKI